MAEQEARRILIADAEADTCRMLADMMRSQGFEAHQATSVDEVFDMLRRTVYDIAFLDHQISGGENFEHFERIRSEYPTVRGIIVSGKKNTELAIRALRVGSFDFITKPIHLSEVRRTLLRAVESIEKEQTHISRERFTGKSAKFRERRLIGRSAKMRELREMIDRVADSGATVLIRGESGTGKELVAQALHHRSPRRKGPLVPVNCGAIPEDLLESELFGHVRGAFTGAVRDRAGRFVLANEGTIFLDEIGDMSPKLQVKVLRVLQEQELEPVGGGQTIHVNVRVVAATNVDLEQAVRERRFREDLYYRLNVVPIDVPPLRERAEDLEMLIEHFIKVFNKRQDRQIKAFAPQTIAILQNNPWYGNVRELENLVERMMILARGQVVMPEDLPPKFLHPHLAQPMSQSGLEDVALEAGTATARSQLTSDGVTNDERMAFRMAATANVAGGGGAGGYLFPTAVPEEKEVTLSGLVDDFERALILDALEKNNGVKSRAARQLGIKRTTLVEKMKKKDILYEKSG
ncbi:MAG: sigma-54-dependent transcriptional regulator [Candidatus Sumerlaeota bacterium]